MSSISENSFSIPGSSSFEGLSDLEDFGSPFSSEKEPESENSPPKYQVILVGDSKVEEILRRKIQKRDLSTQLTKDALLWSRDARVIRPDGVHLLPNFFPCERESFRDFFFCLLPKQMLHFYLENLAFMGRGASREYQNEAIRAAKTLGQRFEKASTCIEGGNCLIFTASDGEPKAIIGYNTLLLSFISLYGTSYFRDRKDWIATYKDECDTKSLTFDELRIAKNVYLFLENEEDFNVRESSENPEDPRFIDFAKELQGMLELTKRKIAKDLGIAPHRIAFVFQERFHIDLELFAAPGPRGDLVFLHDEKLMIHAQASLCPSPEKAPFIAAKTFPFSMLHVDSNREILDYNTRELEKIGCAAVRVPGVLTAKYRYHEEISYPYVIDHWMDDDYDISKQGSSSEPLESHNLYPTMISFMNGLYFNDPHPWFITSAPPKGSPVGDTLTKAFKDAVHEVYPELKISYIREEIPRLLIECSGGLRCITSRLEMGQNGS